jgi:hypothetical protein
LFISIFRLKIEIESVKNRTLRLVENPTIYVGDEEKMFITYSCLPAGREGGVQSTSFSNGVHSNL